MKINKNRILESLDDWAMAVQGQIEKARKNKDATAGILNLLQEVSEEVDKATGQADHMLDGNMDEIFDLIAGVDERANDTIDRLDDLRFWLDFTLKDYLEGAKQ